MFIVILTVTNASALEISFDSPNNIKLNQEFTIVIQADSQENHDVKIFVHNSEDDKIKSEEYISEIYNNGWKNPWYYLKESYPDQTEYEIRAIASPGEREICVRLRKSGSDSFSTECKPITILEDENEPPPEQEPAQTEEELPIKENEEQKTEAIDKKTEERIQTLSTNNKEPIQPSPETLPEKQITTKSSKLRSAVLYSFIFLLAVLVILLALRRL